MKRILLLTALIVTVSLPTLSQPPMMRMDRFSRMQENMKKDTLWGAYCYREIDGKPSGATSLDEPFSYFPLRDGEKMVYYVLADKCTASLTIHLHGEKKAQAMLNVTVKDISTGKVVAKKVIKNKFKGEAESIYAMQTANLPSKSWYRIELSAENWLAIQSIDYLVFEHDSDSGMKPSPLLTSPTVHLGWQTTDESAPQGEAYDWAYVEVMLPQQYEVTNTNLIPLGILSGYVGMQTIGSNNSTNFKRTAIFSMWDNGDIDEDPNLPDYLRQGALDHGDDVAITRFNDNGTGTQSLISDAPWQSGKWMQFILTCRPERIEIPLKGTNTVAGYDNTLVSAWYKAADEKEWHYLATLRETGYNHYIEGWYSMLENFADNGGDIYRRAYFRNAYLHSLADNKWHGRNKVALGNTQGSTEEPRYDFGHGATSAYANCFYLEEGGYTLEANDSATTVTMGTDLTPVDTINLQTLWAQVEDAISNNTTAGMDAMIAEATEQADKLSALKALAKEQIDNANRFGYYTESDLKDLESIYDNGQTTDAAGLAMYLRDLAVNGRLLKGGRPVKVEHLGVSHAYQICLDDGQALMGTANKTELTSGNVANDDAYNWQFIRQGNTDQFQIVNMATKQYLAPASYNMISSTPVTLTVAVRPDNNGFTLSQGDKRVECNLIDNYYHNHIK